MLRFDIPPVFANVVRWEAFIVFALCLLALFVSPWFLAVLPLQGLVKGFIGHHKCPSHLLWKKLFVSIGWQGKKENAGAKMFAGKPQWKIPASALLIFSFLEWAFAFCAACSVYNAWYRYFPPKSV